jgi:hypothetical protein
LGHLLARGGYFGRGFGERILAFFILGDVEIEARFFEVGPMLAPGVDDAFERRLFA